MGVFELYFFKYHITDSIFSRKYATEVHGIRALFPNERNDNYLQRFYIASFKKIAG